MLEIVLAGGAKQGFKPDFGCCAEDVPQGRPAPWMIFRSMEALGVFPPAAVLNIGDTLPDVESGHNRHLERRHNKNGQHAWPRS